MRRSIAAGSAQHDAEALRDIKPIRVWSAPTWATTPPRPGVGTADDPRVVLLVRGQLIKPYPNVIVYAATAAIVPDTIGDYQERHPVFRNSAAPA